MKILLAYKLTKLLPLDKLKGLLDGTHAIHRNPPKGLKRPRDPFKVPKPQAD